MERTCIQLLDKLNIKNKSQLPILRADSRGNARRSALVERSGAQISVWTFDLGKQDALRKVSVLFF